MPDCEAPLDIPVLRPLEPSELVIVQQILMARFQSSDITEADADQYYAAAKAHFSAHLNLREFSSQTRGNVDRLKKRFNVLAAATCRGGSVALPIECVSLSGVAEGLRKMYTEWFRDVEAHAKSVDLAPYEMARIVGGNGAIDNFNHDLAIDFLYRLKDAQRASPAWGQSLRDFHDYVEESINQFEIDIINRDLLRRASDGPVNTFGEGILAEYIRIAKSGLDQADRLFSDYFRDLESQDNKARSCAEAKAMDTLTQGLHSKIAAQQEFYSLQTKSNTLAQKEASAQIDGAQQRVKYEEQSFLALEKGNQIELERLTLERQSAQDDFAMQATTFAITMQSLRNDSNALSSKAARAREIIAQYNPEILKNYLASETNLEQKKVLGQEMRAVLSATSTTAALSRIYKLKTNGLEDADKSAFIAKSFVYFRACETQRLQLPEKSDLDYMASRLLSIEHDQLKVLKASIEELKKSHTLEVSEIKHIDDLVSGISKIIPMYEGALNALEVTKKRVDDSIAKITRLTREKHISWVSASNASISMAKSDLRASAFRELLIKAQGREIDASKRFQIDSLLNEVDVNTQKSEPFKNGCGRELDLGLPSPELDQITDASLALATKNLRKFLRGLRQLDNVIVESMPGHVAKKNSIEDLTKALDESMRTESARARIQKFGNILTQAEGLYSELGARAYTNTFIESTLDIPLYPVDVSPRRNGRYVSRYYRTVDLFAHPDHDGNAGLNGRVDDRSGSRGVADCESSALGECSAKTSSGTTSVANGIITREDVRSCFADSLALEARHIDDRLGAIEEQGSPPSPGAAQVFAANSSFARWYGSRMRALYAGTRSLSQQEKGQVASKLRRSWATWKYYQTMRRHEAMTMQLNDLASNGTSKVSGGFRMSLGLDAYEKAETSLFKSFQPFAHFKSVSSDTTPFKFHCNGLTMQRSASDVNRISVAPRSCADLSPQGLSDNNTESFENQDFYRKSNLKPAAPELPITREARLRAGSFFGTIGLSPSLDAKIDLPARTFSSADSFGGLNLLVTYVYRANVGTPQQSRLFNQSNDVPLSPLADTLLSDVFLPEKDGPVFEGKDVLEWWIDAPADQAPESCSLLKD